MARYDYLFTSESVSEGHPDKVSDRISDEVVDLFFREGPKEGMSPWDIRAACETLCTTNRVVIAGETRGPKSVGAGAVEDVARQAIELELQRFGELVVHTPDDTTVLGLPYTFSTFDSGFLQALHPSGCPDSNWGPLRPERSALPGCATPRACKIYRRRSARRSGGIQWTAMSDRPTRHGE